MTNQFKTIVAIGGLIALFVFAFSYWSYINAYRQSIEPSNFRSISVSAEAKELGIPDVAQFSFSVITEGGKDINDLLKVNTAKINAAINFLKSEGIEDKDIKTTAYNLLPRYQTYNCESGKICPPPEIVGYTITQTVSVKIRDFNKIGGILSGVITKGANSVSELNFTIDDPSELELKAKVKAIAEAQKKARAIAQAAGVHLGRLLDIDTSIVSPYSQQPYNLKALRNAAATPEAINIEAGSQEIQATVTLRYEIR